MYYTIEPYLIGATVLVFGMFFLFLLVKIVTNFIDMLTDDDL